MSFTSGQNQLAVFVGLLLLLSNAAGQSMLASVQCSPSYDWATNSLGQNPCTVAGKLQSVCSPSRAHIEPLQGNDEYHGPANASDADPCVCSTVVYSLMSACGDCQNHTFLSWTDWKNPCPNWTIGSFPSSLPPDTAVPDWAYMDVTKTNEYNASLAKDDHQPESIASSTRSSTTGSSTSTASAQSATSVPVESSGLSKSINIGAIVGAGIGGLVFIALVIVLLIKFRDRYRRSHMAPSTLYREMLSADPGQGPLASPMDRKLAEEYQRSYVSLGQMSPEPRVSPSLSPSPLGQPLRRESAGGSIDEVQRSVRGDSMYSSVYDTHTSVAHLIPARRQSSGDILSPTIHRPQSPPNTDSSHVAQESTPLRRYTDDS